MKVSKYLKAMIIEHMKQKNLWSFPLEVQVPDTFHLLTLAPNVGPGTLALFPVFAFRSERWIQAGDSLWEDICKFLGCKGIIRKGPTNDDEFRSPNVEFLYGSQYNIVMKKEHGIVFTWDVTKVMFSFGNVSEKERISRFNCTGETIVDMYTGIGYFTLPFLVNAKADLVYACEWNPAAVEALRLNLKANKVSERCIVLVGDNKKTCPKNVADRVNLGILPMSASSLKTAICALKLTGGVLYVHDNVNCHPNNIPIDEAEQSKTQIEDVCDLQSKPIAWRNWARSTALKILKIGQSEYLTEMISVSIIGVSKIKSYAPHIDHVVLDVQVKFLFYPEHWPEVKQRIDKRDIPEVALKLSNGSNNIKCL